jgi:eukaryotic-like serine/threonine-protein kinase
MSRKGRWGRKLGGAVGTYRIIRKLSAGSVADVFLARMAGTGGVESPVFIERLLPGFAGEATFVDLFLGSARASATQPHANVLRVLEAGVSGELPCRVLELVDGETLSSLFAAVRTRGLTLGLREVCFIVQQVAEGLASLHQVRPSHRGLQPSLVWLSRRGEVKLVDTGGASRSEPPYLTPEQVQGRPADARGDVFRLGLLLYELLAGRPLFDGSQPRVLHHIRTFDERALAPVPGCPPSLWAVLRQTLAASPEARFTSARVVAGTLRDFLVERQLGVDHLDIAQLFARVFPARRSFLEEAGSSQAETLSQTDLTPARPEAMLHIVPVTEGRRLNAEPPPVLYPVEPPPPPDDALLETEPAPPRQPPPENVHARLLGEALGLVGGSAELAPLLVRLTRGGVWRLGGSDEEETRAALAARTLVLAARLEEPRRFVLPTLARVRTLVGESPELGELLSDVLLAGRNSGPPSGRAARALLCAAAFVAQVQCAEPEEPESIRALGRLRQDPRVAPEALEALAAELGVEAPRQGRRVEATASASA